MDDAIAHCTRGIGVWEWASTDGGGEPDVVLGCAGDVPTLETLSAAARASSRRPSTLTGSRTASTTPCSRRTSR
jgi:xylulose-5-phosphate/fructose-6-phosphate phosphoketolase